VFVFSDSDLRERLGRGLLGDFGGFLTFFLVPGVSVRPGASRFGFYEIRFFFRVSLQVRRQRFFFSQRSFPCDYLDAAFDPPVVDGSRPGDVRGLLSPFPR